eukprot:4919173-Amphidinium_carterae.1
MQVDVHADHLRQQVPHSFVRPKLQSLKVHAVWRPQGRTVRVFLVKLVTERMKKMLHDIAMMMMMMMMMRMMMMMMMMSVDLTSVYGQSALLLFMHTKSGAGLSKYWPLRMCEDESTRTAD